jgi:hypothetical protein
VAQPAVRFLAWLTRCRAEEKGGRRCMRHHRHSMMATQPVRRSKNIEGLAPPHR